jgi:cysteine desulfurase/selenocysteine lyase
MNIQTGAIKVSEILSKIPFEVEQVRKEFPILGREVNGHPLIYLDSGASAQKPNAVIDCVTRYYQEQHANIHRGVHHLSQEATQAYEDARQTIRAFINARHAHEVLFTKGTTDSINLVASSFGRAHLKPGDEIIISTMEHHSNIVPWQLICEQTGAVLKVIPINREGELLMDEYESMLNERTKIIAVAHVSNSLGTINPVAEIIELAHHRNIPVLLDAAQAVPHMHVDVQGLDVDFFAFSGHKMFGPTGVGILYGKESLLNNMPPYQGGGDMIERVTFEKTTYNTLPHKFEAGTPNIVGGIGLGAAVDFICGYEEKDIAAHEKDILDYATSSLGSITGVNIIGTAADKASVISFLLDGTHPFDVGTILDQLGIAVRTGHHCTQPLMDFYGVPGTVRASFALYNNRADVDALVAGVDRAASMLL